MIKGLSLITLISFILLGSMTANAAKRGLAWPWNGNSSDFSLFANNSKTSWVYNWESWRPGGVPSSLEYVAMQRTRDGLANLQNNMKSNGAKVLLGFNEPDISSQANLTVDDAVQLWKQYIQPYSQLTLGSPAISNGPNGISWLQQFFAKCTGCKIDFVACHWYGPDFGHFQSFIEDVHSTFADKKIWITEFALQGSPSQANQSSFLTQAKTYLEASTFVDRYAWFGAFRGTSGNNLINNNGTLTTVGQNYIK